MSDASAKRKNIKQLFSDYLKEKRLFMRLPLEEQILFTKRLAILLKGGVRILEALNMMQSQTTSRTLKIILEDLLQGVANGQTLSGGMKAYKKFFGDLTINLIHIGEISGTLHENLAYLAEELKKKKELRRKVISSMVYPIFIVVATIGVTLLLAMYVFPKILPILQTFSGELPITTRALIFVTNTLSRHTLIVFLVLGGMVASGFGLMRLRRVRFFVDRNILRIPIFGRLFIAYHMANFCRTLGLLLKSDVRIVEASTIVAKTNANLAYRKELSEMTFFISRGEKISDFLASRSKMFPPMVYQMITVSETAGNLSNTLLYLGEIYESEVDELTKNLSSLIEPALMIFMGILVGFVALSIITPIYQLTGNLNPYK